MTKMIRHLFTFMLGIKGHDKRLGKELNLLVDIERVIISFFVTAAGFLNGTQWLSAEKPKLVSAYFLIFFVLL